MRLGSTLALYAAMGIAGSIGGQNQQAVPPTVRSALDRMHPGWRVGTVGEEVTTVVGARLGATPNVIVGDFDGNGRPDVAVLIEYRNTAEPEKAFTHYIEIIAFLNTGTGYQPMPLQERTPGPDSDRYLTLQRRGGQGFDFEANRKFIYPHDSIGVWFFGKAGGTYIYDNGQFRYVTESD